MCSRETVKPETAQLLREIAIALGMVDEDCGCETGCANCWKDTPIILVTHPG